MFKFYICSMLIYILSLIILVIRCFIFRNKINFKKHFNSSKSEDMYEIFQILIIGILPIINIVYTIILLCYGIFMSNDDFIEFCNS